MKKCPEIGMRAEISRLLGRALHNMSKGFGAVDLFDGLMEDFVDASDFVDYFKAVWYPRIGKAFSFRNRGLFAFNKYHYISMFSKIFSIVPSVNERLRPFNQ